MHFNALSLFSSGGVAETYFAKHGVFIKVASELLPQRAKFHKHLYPDAQMIQGDITTKALFDEMIKASVKNGVEFILATPPCQGMSTAGLQRKEDSRNRLILTVIDAILRLHPKFVITRLCHLVFQKVRFGPVFTRVS